MLNTSRVLDFVKSNLGFPFVSIEITDDQITDYIKTYTLREFSQYVPWVKRISMNLTLETLQVSGRQNEYYIPVSENEEIISVSDVYFSDSDLYFHGHPVLGPLNHGQIAEFVLGAVTAMDTKMFSSYDRTFEYIHPNIVRISPVTANTTYVTAEVELVQPDDFSQVPNDLQTIFMELAASDIMIKVGALRQKYSGGTLRTPFGEIPVNSEIYQEGKDKKRDILEKLRLCHPNVILDIG